MKDDIKLPPLPKGDIDADTCPVMWVHTDQQLQDYAYSAIEPYQKRIAELEAKLEAVLKAMDELANGYAGNRWDVGIVPRLEKARAAIAKARGEEE